MATEDSIETRAVRLRHAFERRYPGLCVEVSFNDHRQLQIGSDYMGWVVRFEHRDPHELVRLGLAENLAAFEDRPGLSGNVGEFAGCRWHGHGPVDSTERHAISFHIEEQAGGARDRALTKKMQAQVERLLRPFVRGTWTPAVRP